MALRDAAAEAAQDADTFCVVVRGSGPTFSAGIDLAQLAPMAGQSDLLRPFRARCIEMVNLFEEMPKPVVAQIQGGCIGLGAELALACDMRVMADDVKFSLPEVKLGLIPDVGGSSRLPALAGLGRAKELIMTGRTIGASECERIGVANRFAPLAQLEASTQELVDELLAASPLAVGAAKRVMDGIAKPTLATSLELEVSLQQMLVGSEDFREAGIAYMEQREPRWSGRTPAAPAPEQV
jgi:enoyl-CoA hydratase/carnithine racemase